MECCFAMVAAGEAVAVAEIQKFGNTDGCTRKLETWTGNSGKKDKTKSDFFRIQRRETR
jgi:hypothetical protein